MKTENSITVKEMLAQLEASHGLNRLWGATTSEAVRPDRQGVRPVASQSPVARDHL